LKDLARWVLIKSPRMISGFMVSGGETGIRTLDGSFPPYSLSRQILDFIDIVMNCVFYENPIVKIYLMFIRICKIGERN